MKAQGGICVQTIVLHSTGCPALTGNPEEELNVAVRELDGLVEEVFGLMQKYKIPFYQVVPHHSACPGPRFPWEDLEFQLFTLEH